MFDRVPITPLPFAYLPERGRTCDACYLSHSIIQVKFIAGSDKDDTGVLINIDGLDGIIKMDRADSLKILQLDFLAKYVPNE